MFPQAQINIAITVMLVLLLCADLPGQKAEPDQKTHTRPDTTKIEKHQKKMKPGKSDQPVKKGEAAKPPKANKKKDGKTARQESPVNELSPETNKPAPVPEPNSEPLPEHKPESLPEPQSESLPEHKPESLPESLPEPLPESLPEPESEPIPENDPFPDYQPKQTPGSAVDFMPALAEPLSLLPEPTADNLAAYLELFERYQQEAREDPGEWYEGNMILGARPREYNPTMTELLLAETGERIRMICENHSAADIRAVLSANNITAREISYRHFTFIHMDVMGSGRFFYVDQIEERTVPLVN